jgi:hypothetical protein
MTTNTAGSSDVDIARALSRRLSGLRSGSGPTATGSQPYLRFTSSTAETPPAAESGAAATDEPLNDFTRWDEFLAWSLNKVRSSASFAIDPQGFVIGSSGNVPEDGFEGTGAELSYVMSQADVMNPEMGSLRSIALDFANRRLSGFRSDVTGGEGFVVAFIDAEGFNKTTQLQIARQLEHSFSVLL